jgi:VCBS repeat protein/FG-GAP repeat protein
VEKEAMALFVASLALPVATVLVLGGLLGQPRIRGRSWGSRTRPLGRVARLSLLAVTIAVLVVAPAPVHGAGGNFTGVTNVDVGAGGGPLSPRSVAAGDFNGDSDPDLAVANEGSDSVSIFVGGDGGSFGPGPSKLGAGDGPEAVVVGDFKGDSDHDLAVANQDGDQPESVVVGDFNGDSDPDLAVGNFQSRDVSVLLGTTPP